MGCIRPDYVWGAIIVVSDGFKAARLGIIIGLPLFFLSGEADYGQAAITVLDVGQALSMIIRTQHHTLIFDTGDYYSEHFTAAEQTIFTSTTG